MFKLSDEVLCEGDKGELTFSPGHMKGTDCQHYLPFMNLTLIVWLRWSF